MNDSVRIRARSTPTGSPYRLARSSTDAPVELTLRAGIPEELWLAATPAGALRLSMWVPVAIVIGTPGTATLVLAFFVLSGVGYAAWLLEPRKRAARVELRVVNGELMVRRSDRTAPLRLRLDDVVGIRVDSETEKAFAIRGYGVRATTLGTTLARARVVLDLANEVPPVSPSGALLSHADGIDWVPQTHRFLRAHGWGPAADG